MRPPPAGGARRRLVPARCAVEGGRTAGPAVYAAAVHGHVGQARHRRWPAARMASASAPTRLVLCPHVCAVHREPAESWHTFSSSTFHPLAECPEQQLQLAAPAGAAPQSLTTAAGLLVSRDGGASWKVVGDIEVRGGWIMFPPGDAGSMPCGCATQQVGWQLSSPMCASPPPRPPSPQDPKTWLVNPVLEQGSKGQLIMLFRTAVVSRRRLQAGQLVAAWPMLHKRPSLPDLLPLPRPPCQLLPPAQSNTQFCSCLCSSRARPTSPPAATGAPPGAAPPPTRCQTPTPSSPPSPLMARCAFFRGDCDACMR